MCKRSHFGADVGAFFRVCRHVVVGICSLSASVLRGPARRSFCKRCSLLNCEVRIPVAAQKMIKVHLSRHNHNDGGSKQPDMRLAARVSTIVNIRKEAEVPTGSTGLP